MNLGTIDLSRYKLVLDENFRAPVFNAQGAGTDPIWYTDTPWPFGNNSWQPPLGPDHQPFALGPKGLTITATKDAAGAWHSGLLCSVNDAHGTKGNKFAPHGYFEAVMQIPDASGTWPSFWLNSLGDPASDASPAVEVDVIEYYGHDNTTFQSVVHVWGGAGQLRETFCTPMVAPAFLNGAFHAYGVEIRDDAIRFYLDRECYWQTSKPPEMTRELAILVDFAMGGGWPLPTVSSLSMIVKSVQVYQ